MGNPLYHRLLVVLHSGCYLPDRLARLANTKVEESAAYHADLSNTALTNDAKSNDESG